MTRLKIEVVAGSDAAAFRILKMLHPQLIDSDKSGCITDNGLNLIRHAHGTAAVTVEREKGGSDQ